MNKRVILLLLVAGFSISAKAQQASNEFLAMHLAAKQLLDKGQFGLAMQSYKQLLATNEINDIVPFTQFYLGYSAYYNGDISFAKDVFLQLTIKYPKWNKIEAAYLWLSNIGFQQSNPFSGLLYATEIKSEPYLSKSNVFLKSQLKNQPIEILISLFEQYSTNRIVAEAYVIALSNQPRSSENASIHDFLISEFNFKYNKFTAIPQSEFKDKYTVGILLPIFMDRAEASGKYLKKSLAIDMYEGAKMALLTVDHTRFRVKVFDTEMNSRVISDLESKGIFDDLDAILGPIYDKPVNKMIAIAKSKKINFVNATSTNPKISASSPYAFLSRASATQLAVKAAEYMKQQDINKNYIIYYGSDEVDAIAAFEYKQALELDSFNIDSFVKINKHNRRQVYDYLTKSITVLDKKIIDEMTQEEIETLMQLPTIDSLLIQPNSIGHIFIASSDPTLSTEAMSAIISRGDSIKIMGIGNWYESDNVGLGIMEGLGVCLSISAFDDVSAKEHRALIAKYIKKYNKKPEKYFFRGYYGMKFIAESLIEYGTYFQNGSKQKGNLNSTHDLEHSNFDGSVRIVKMIDHKIVDVSSEHVTN